MSKFMVNQDDPEKSWNNLYQQRFKSTEKRFWEKVNKHGDECWEWLGSKDEKGYGYFWDQIRNTKAHRYSWTTHYGRIQKDKIICHHCDNPSCVNPNHLFLGTHQDNANDREAKGRRKNVVGENSPNSKLTDDDVRAIRKQYSSRNYTLDDLSKEFGVCFQQISRIVNRKRWKHI